MDYCETCGAELPGDCSQGCADEINPAGREGFDSLVDLLMARGYDRDEAEARAVDIMENDAA